MAHDRCFVKPDPAPVATPQLVWLLGAAEHCLTLVTASDGAKPRPGRRTLDAANPLSGLAGYAFKRGPCRVFDDIVVGRNDQPRVAGLRVLEDVVGADLSLSAPATADERFYVAFEPVEQPLPGCQLAEPAPQFVLPRHWFR